MKIFHHLLWLLLFFPAFLPAQETGQMTLDQAIQYALANNISLKGAQLSIADAKEQIVERRSIGIPQLRGSANYQYFVDIPTQILPDFLSPSVYGILFSEGLLEPRNIETSDGVPAQFGTRHNFTAGLNFSTLVFDASYLTGLQAARLFKDYTQKEFEVKQFNLRHQVAQSFYPLLILQENMETLDKNIANLDKLLTETKALYKEGFVEQLDVDRLELSLWNLQTEKQNLQRQQEVAANALKFTIGYPLDQPLAAVGDLDSELTDMSPEALTGAVSYDSRPEYQQANMGLELSDINIRYIKAGYIPALNGFGTYQQSLFANKLSEGEWFPTTVVGLQLNVPIFDGLQKRAQVQRARIAKEIAQYQITDLQRAIDLEVLNARTSYINAAERLKSQQRNLELAQKIYQTTQVKYREGVGSSLEITQAEQALYTSQQNLYQALYELVLAKANLEKALGIQ